MRNSKAEAGSGAATASQEWDAAAVREQVVRVLGSPHFRNSKRSQALLRYVVESSLAGDIHSLKERCIGAAVFSRDPAYDTAQDPIVRNAAIDVRKRLAQYYLEPDHAGELRIDLPSGSYQAVFAESATAGAPEPATASPSADLAPPVVESAPSSRSRSKAGILAVAVALAAAVASYVWFTSRTPASELDAFWAPLFRDGKTVQICIGQPTRLFRFTGPRMEELSRALGGPEPRREAAGLSVGAGELRWVAPEYLYLRDALSAFRVASWIQGKGHPFQLMSVASTNYSQLRHTPLVAIGAFNNTWSMRVTSELRFVFDRRSVDGQAYNCIVDRRNPAALNWKVVQPVPSAIHEDFAIVTRVFDPTTERTVISAAGIEAFGTLAAGEFVTQPDYLGAALRSRPERLEGQNVQFVLSTKVIDGTPGPPRVVAAHYW